MMDIIDVKTKCKSGEWRAFLNNGTILLACEKSGECVAIGGIDLAAPHNEETAEWVYWPGWAGNHDKRIDDATCSHCGYKHPIVRGGPHLLSSHCPGCGRKMKKE